jgi:hypothetical protein
MVLRPNGLGDYFHHRGNLFLLGNFVSPLVSICSFLCPPLSLRNVLWGRVGAVVPMFMSIQADLYKGKLFGTIYGMVEGSVGIGAASGAWLAGFIFVQTQDYLWALILAIFFNLISISLVWVAAPPKFRDIKSSIY